MFFFIYEDALIKSAFLCKGSIYNFLEHIFIRLSTFIVYLYCFEILDWERLLEFVSDLLKTSII